MRELFIRAKNHNIADRFANHKAINSIGGYEFMGLREYIAGDDVRRIDYKASAKGDKIYYREFHHTKELHIVTATLLSGSIAFGTYKTKLDLVSEIVATIGYSAIKAGDSYSHFSAIEDSVSFYRCNKNRFLMQKAAESMAHIELLGRDIDVAGVIKQISKRLTRRSLIIFIGDFYNEISFRALSKKHEIVSIIVRDRFEESPTLMGFNTLYNPSSGLISSLNLNKEDLNHFKEAVRAKDIEVEKSLYDSGVRFIKIYTDDDIYKKLRELFI